MAKGFSFLKSGETVVASVGLHWMVFGYALIWSVATVLIFTFYTNLALFSGVVILIAVGAWGEAMIRYMTKELTLTNQRLLISSGFINHRLDEVPLTNLKAVRIEQTTWQKLLGYGTLVLVGQTDSEMALPTIADVKTFAGSLEDMLPEPVEAAPAAAPTAPSEPAPQTQPQPEDHANPSPETQTQTAPTSSQGK